MRQKDSAIFDPGVVGSLNKGQAVNYIREAIASLRAEVASMPSPPTNNLASREYVTWERRMMITHGRAMGALQALQAFGFISVLEFKHLKREIIGAVLARTADEQMGVKR